MSLTDVRRLIDGAPNMRADFAVKRREAFCGTPSLMTWLPDGYSQILRLYLFGPSGLKDHGSATLRCKICHLATLVDYDYSSHLTNRFQGRVRAGEVHPPLRELLPRGQRRRLRLRRQQATELPEPEKVDQEGEGPRKRYKLDMTQELINMLLIVLRFPSQRFPICKL